MAEASLTLAKAAPPRRRCPRPGGPYGHKLHSTSFQAAASSNTSNSNSTRRRPPPRRRSGEHV
eukprot:scaffold44540_cov27-Tisochrysis_lutea.AAC.1